MNTDILSNWKRIERWLQSHAPEALEQFEPPASPEAIARVTETVGGLPDDYLALLGVHDGIGDEGIGVFEGFVPFSLEEALDARGVMQRVTQEGRRAYPDVHDSKMRPEPGVRKLAWHDAWLPVAVSAADPRTMIFMDLDPAPGGTRGQLVRHVVDMDTLPIVAGSVAEWVERIANAMENGRVVVERGKRCANPTWSGDARAS
jgi:cell wall assembly regulator SMI1